MNAKQKTQWIDALRSGKYKQTYGELFRCRDGEVYHCCLGVAAKVWHPNTFPNIDSITKQLDEKLRVQFIRFNDVLNWSFEQIADWIETNVPTTD